MTFGHVITNRYMKMGASLSTHHRLLAAKASLIKSAIPHPLKQKMVKGYQSTEKSLFGRTTPLPGENELGVGGMGTTFGMRQQLKKVGTAEANASDSQSSSDLYQSVLSRFSGDSSVN